MEHGACESVSEQFQTKMAIKTEVKVTATSTAHIDSEIGLKHLKQEPMLIQVVKSEPALLVTEEMLGDSRQAAMMEHGVSKSVKEQLGMEMAIKSEAETAAASTAAHIDNEIDLNHLKQEPWLKQFVQSETALLLKGQMLSDSRQGTRGQQHIPATSTRSIVGRPRVASDSVEQQELLRIKEQLEDTDLVIGPIVLQHMDSHYITNMIGSNDMKQENIILNRVHEEAPPGIDDGQVVHSQVRDETIGVSQKDSSSGFGSKSYRCKVCNKNFKLRRDLSRHTKQVHNSQSNRCDKCPNVFKSKTYLRRHHKRVHGTESLKCAQCKKEFKCKDYLLNHVRNTHNSRNYECDICKKMYQTKLGLRLHVSNFHHNKSAGPCDCCLKKFDSKSGLTSQVHFIDGCKPYRCKVCNKNFECRLVLSRHTNQVHDSEKPKCQIYRCDKCSKVFKTKSILWCHHKHLHGIESFQCMECKKEFKCKAYLQNHVRQAHSEEQFECVICKKMCISRAALSNHILYFHGYRFADPADRKYHCDKCVKTFKSNFAFNRHCKYIHGTERHKCADCNKEYRLLRDLQTHIDSGHSKHQFECEICDKILTSKLGLSRHMLRLHNRSFSGWQPHSYTCDHCGKSFFQKESLRGHIEGVHGERIHQCLTCNSTFTSKPRLRNHKISIHGEHQCEICHRRFTARNKLKAHVEEAHALDNIPMISKSSSVTSDMTVLVGSGTQQHDVGAAKSELADAEMELGPVVLQHIDSNYRPYKEELQLD